MKIDDSVKTLFIYKNIKFDSKESEPNQSHA